MDAEHSAAWVRRWVGVYTRGLSPDVRLDRLDEIDDDLWSQLHDAGATGRGERSLAREIVARMVLGIPADLSWRLEQRRSPSRQPTTPRNPTMFARVISAIAIIGGIAWATWLIPATVVLKTNDWGSPLYIVALLCAAVGSLGLSVATFSLVFANLDRLRPVAAILGSIGGLAGGLVIAGFYAGGFVALPIGSAVLMLDLARIGVVGRYLALLQTAAAVVIPVPGVILLSTEGNISNPVPFVVLIVSVATYALTWVPIGWSLRHGEWLPEAPAPGA
jgi:hypothetical protein